MLQVSLILYRLLREGRLPGADSQHVQRLLAALESDPEQAAAEDRDESVSPERLFSEALRSAAVPGAVVEARAVLSHVLRQRAHLLYRGVHFERYATPVARLTAVLRNVWLHRDKFPRRVHQALKVMTDFLHIKIAEGEIDPYTFDFAAVFDVAVSSHAPEIVQQAKSVLLNAIKRRPALFKKLLALRVRDSDSEHQTARAVVTALSARRRQLSMKIRTALSLLAKFLQGQHIDQNDTFIRNMLTDDDYNEAADYDRHYVTLPVAKFKAKNRRF
ncbi:uncharacterized protein LOC126285163 [Schistocerca gregaria]|uniref:uncharacterized protein LOC126285163 n=1 Tax=Schistocerca gregaria TaxID=7010 RepID=UPI00211E13C7|nr:uncharacterized protein LOC126285163 [Schistocerca gregaria]